MIIKVNSLCLDLIRIETQCDTVIHKKISLSALKPHRKID